MPDTLQPEHALFLRQLGLRTLAQERRLTSRVIAAIPPNHVDYRPDPISRPALELAWHIVGSEIMFLEGIAAGAFVYGAARPESLRAPADIVAWYRERSVDGANRLKALSSEQLLRPTDFRGMFQQPAIMFLQTAIRHSAHHRGQLSVYLRPMGAKVPPIYGDSHEGTWVPGGSPGEQT